MAQLPVPYTKYVSLPVGSFVKIKGTFVLPFKHVKMNSRQGENWEEEEVRASVISFEDGQPFELGILVLSKEYQVIVNGHQSYTFPHRYDPASVKMIRVWRDVSLTSVTVT